MIIKTGVVEGTGRNSILKLKNGELEPSNPLARELELKLSDEAPKYFPKTLIGWTPPGYLDESLKEKVLFFSGDTSQGRGLYQLIIFPRSVS